MQLKDRATSFFFISYSQ